MRINVDRERCEGYGMCEETAPELMHLDDEGELVIDVHEIPAEYGGRAESAVRVCPVAALQVSNDEQ